MSYPLQRRTRGRCPVSRPEPKLVAPAVPREARQDKSRSGYRYRAGRNFSPGRTRRLWRVEIWLWLPGRFLLKPRSGQIARKPKNPGLRRPLLWRLGFLSLAWASPVSSALPFPAGFSFGDEYRTSAPLYLATAAVESRLPSSTTIRWWTLGIEASASSVCAR